MAVLSGCSLCRLPNYVQVKLESNKKIFLVYSIFLILLIEWFSIFYLWKNPVDLNIPKDHYTVKMYPALTQLALFILFFSIFLWRDRLHFCFRKSATAFYLSCYYLLGFIGVITCLSANFYYSLIIYTSLVLATFLFIVSFFKKLD